MEKKEFEELFDRLFPILRSITGPGTEKSLEIISEYIPIKVKKVASDTDVFDWKVPMEWHLHEAKLSDENGRVICDVKNNNLHVVNYSMSKSGMLKFEELEPHLHTLKNQPDAIPYVTSYYKKDWGFCISQNEKDSLDTSIKYHVNIKSEFIHGGVPYGQFLLTGKSKKEILLTSYICHPSLANNELSGPLVLISLYQKIKNWRERNYSYRFLFNPETIGSLCFLHNHYSEIKDNLIAGLVLTCLGGPNEKLTYKSSRQSVSIIDRIFKEFYPTKNSESINIKPFTAIGGSDERQFCSPGFNLPIGQISRTTYGQYPEYHTSLDNKAFLNFDHLVDSTNTIEHYLQLLDKFCVPINTKPYGEPQLGKYGLYPTINSNENRDSSENQLKDGRRQLNNILKILNAADGTTDIFKMSHDLEIPINELNSIIQLLEQKKIINRKL